MVRPIGREVLAVLALAGSLITLAGCDSGGQKGQQGASEPKTAGSQSTAPLLMLAPPLPPTATLAEALAHPDPLERARHVARILEESGPDRLPDIRDEFDRAPLAWGDLEYALFAGWWARFDPVAAVPYFMDDVLRTDHPRVIREVVRIWGYQDPAAVIESGLLRGTSIEMAGLNPGFVEPFVIGWFESRKPGLETWIATLDASSKATAMGSYMRMLILRDGHRAALEWTQTAPVPPDAQRQLLGIGLNVVARQEPLIAIEWLDIAEKKGIDTRTFVARIGRGWATRDPKAAMEWILSRGSDQSERWRTIHDIAEVWLLRDEKGLEAWLVPYAKEEWADQIRKQWVFQHVKRNRYRVDWPMLMKKASEFVNEESRRMEYLWLIQRWKALDPEAATAWLDQNKELLGDKLEYVDQLFVDDRKEIDAVLAEMKAAGEQPGKTVEN